MLRRKRFISPGPDKVLLVSRDFTLQSQSQRVTDDSGEMFGAAKLKATTMQTAEDKSRLDNFLFMLWSMKKFGRAEQKFCSDKKILYIFTTIKSVHNEYCGTDGVAMR